MSEPGRKGPDEKYCSECGAIIRAKAEICPVCGVRQSPPPFTISFGPTAPNGRNRLAAALFAIFLGSFGVHKFYLGMPGWGVIYLVLCWTIIPGILGLIEGILLLVMNDTEFTRQYGGV